MPKTSPMIRAAEAALAKRGVDELEMAPGVQVKRWARGEATLQELKGYDAEELYFISQQGYTLFLNGKFQDAQTIFEGLVAIDPRNDYYYRALGVVYHRRGDAERALKQFSNALKVSPRSSSAYVNRAEVHISRRDYEQALDDLDKALRVAANPDEPVVRKARALRTLIQRRRR
ncbi:MAG: tetratricopeptide repeat protein [Deltaproteobacteria bacterium]|nr:tetratricopeptide repeat protein [Deltaproteobacteria bacterium]